MQVREHQSWLERTFAGRGVQYEKVDIAASGSEKERRYMIDEARKSGKKTILPPQVFVNDKYIGGYDELWDANECEQLLTVLGLAPEPAPPAPAALEPSPVANDPPAPAEKEKSKSPAPDSNANAGAAVNEEPNNEATAETIDSP